MKQIKKYIDYSHIKKTFDILYNLNNIIVFSIIIIIDKFLLVVRESGMFIVMIL
jgi:lipopolysaccharide/colanic/teichoic acid biosynthesis glycosyltransferase